MKTEKAKRFKQTENEVKKAIKEYLEAKGFRVFRINNGGVYRGMGKDNKPRFSFAGDAGVADLFACGHGVGMWVETKATGKRPTLEQDWFLNEINLIGGGHYAVWADSFDMFVSKVEENKELSELFNKRKEITLQ